MRNCRPDIQTLSLGQKAMTTLRAEAQRRGVSMSSLVRSFVATLQPEATEKADSE